MCESSLSLFVFVFVSHHYLFSRARINQEIALDVIAAANLVDLYRLKQLAEIVASKVWRFFIIIICLSPSLLTPIDR